jgi:hypothetical protein
MNARPGDGSPETVVLWFGNGKVRVSVRTPTNRVSIDGDADLKEITRASLLLGAKARGGAVEDIRRQQRRYNAQVDRLVARLEGCAVGEEPDDFQAQLLFDLPWQIALPMFRVDDDISRQFSEHGRDLSEDMCLYDALFELGRRKAEAHFGAMGFDAWRGRGAADEEKV